MAGHDDVLLALATAVAADVPVLLWGAPGTGKSSALVGLAAAAGRPLEVVIASVREPSDFAGLPVVGPAGVSLAAPSWARRLVEAAAGGPPGVVFFDELTTAPPAVQAALLRVVLERVVGDLPLPAGTAVVAAANPPEDAADGWDLAPPVANRFCHLDWAPPAAVISDGLIAGFPAPPTLQLGDLSARLPGARALVAAFLRVRPGLLSLAPGDDAGRAFPSPRSWEMAARLSAAALAAGADSAVGALLVAGCVGVGPAGEFLAWAAELDLPDPEQALADPGAVVVPERGDRVHALVAGVVAAALAGSDPARWGAAWEVLARVAEAGFPDVGALGAVQLARHRPAGAAAPAQARVFAPVLAAAGRL